MGLVQLAKIKMFIHNLKETFFLERFRWFIWSPVLFAAGIGIYFALPFEISKWIVLFLLELLLTLAFVYRANYGRLFVLYNVFIIVLGFAVACLQAYYLSKKIYDAPSGMVYITARITNLEHNYRGRQRIDVEDVHNFDKEHIKGRYRLTLMLPNSAIKVGDCIEAVVDISSSDKPAIVGGYQYHRQLFFDGISGVGYIPSRALVLDDCKSPNIISDFIGNLRQSISKRIFKVLPSDQASIVTAISTGDRGRIKPEIRENYRDSGLAHFLSISGLHITMITGLMFFFIRLITASIPLIATRVDSKKISAFAALLMSIVYLMVSGADIPAQRAFVMTTIVLLGILLDRTAISMRILAIAAFIVLLVSPQSLIGPSFQMSFSAVVALVAFYERYAGGISKFLKGDNYSTSSYMLRFLKICWVYIIGIMLTDLVASITTSVFAVYHFNRIAVYTTFGNMLSGPIIGFIIMPFLLLSLILMPIGLDWLPLKITGFGAGLVNDITKDVASLPNASVQVLSFPTWSILLMVLGGLWVCVWQQKWRTWGWVLIFVGFLGIFSVSNPDIIVNDGASVVAVKDNNGNMIILPSKGNNSLKKLWREKTASENVSKKEYKLLKDIYYNGEVDKDWVDLKCGKKYCDYKARVRIYKSGRLYDIEKKKNFLVPSGGNIRIRSGLLEIETIDEYVGNRIYSK
ncbi:MAG: ComEC family competence protein [Lactobacillaceae bacterium]|jgi:competence protein ComEC|nr:ComEC family competence protein [Lactobacillaceae bacterium]